MECSDIAPVPTQRTHNLTEAISMKTEQRNWTRERGWDVAEPPRLGAWADLVLMFGARCLLADASAMREIHAVYPDAQIVGCSTAGEIAGTSVSDDSIAITAISFAQTRVRVEEVELSTADQSVDCGAHLARALLDDELVHVLVLSDGLHVNGGELVKGLASGLPEHVAITGGLAGDGALFQQTLVYCNGRAADHSIVAVGFYGKRLRVGYGSLGGWDSFGPQRIVTRSRSNVLYELDGESALGLYKRYLGRYADGLPASGLRFPLSIKSSGSTPVVRTILGIDEQQQSLIFAGDIPQGVQARLMRANFERLIDGATDAARATQQAFGSGQSEFALLISCFGRKLVLQQRIEEEVEAVRAVGRRWRVSTLTAKYRRSSNHRSANSTIRR
jgi:hypothetical protein